MEFILENSIRVEMSLREEEYFFTTMVRCLKVISSRVREKVWAMKSFLIHLFTWGTLWMGREKGGENFSGAMEKFMMESGKAT